MPWLKGSRVKLMFMVVQHEKQQGKTERLHWKISRFSCLLPQIKDSHLFYHKHTHLAPRCTFTVQVHIKHSSAWLWFVSHDFLLFPPRFPFIPSFCMRGENENGGGIRWLNCSLFTPSPCVNKEPSSVNWVLQLAVTERPRRDVEYRWDLALVPATFSCHSNLNTLVLNRHKQEQELMKKKVR